MDEPQYADETMPVRKQRHAPRGDAARTRVRTLRFERDRAMPDESTDKVKRVRRAGDRQGDLGRTLIALLGILLVAAACALAWALTR